ncbi:MAG: recombinase family protein [Gallionella sp.]|nr:recombinase family protein [Gallionella sp.]
MAIFAYLRVSTNDQTTEQQLHAITQAGYEVGDRLVYTEQGISGKIPAMQREQFKRLSDQITEGDSLVVAKLDRLGRDTMDVITTIETLIARGVSVVVLGLGVLDSSPTSRLTLTMLAAISQFERELIGERTKAALAVKKANGVVLGRPKKVDNAELKAQAIALLEDQRTSWRKTAAQLDISLSTLQRLVK